MLLRVMSFIRFFYKILQKGKPKGRRRDKGTSESDDYASILYVQGRKIYSRHCGMIEF